MTRSPASISRCALSLEGDVLDLAFDPAALDGRERPAATVDLLDDIAGGRLEFVGERLDVVGPRERVDRVCGAGLVCQDLLGPQGSPNGLLGRKRERLVFAVGVETLSAAEDRCERLIRDPHDVVLDLLGGERRPAGLGVELELRRGGVVRVEPLLDEPRPQPPGGAELRGLLEDVVVRVEEKRELWGERVDVEPGVDRGPHVLEPVRQRERHLLGGRRPRLADVVPGDGDGVQLRHLLGTEREDVRDEPHRRLRRVDVEVARDVLFHDVVLDGAAEVGAVDALSVAHRDVHREQDRRRRVDRHRRRHLVEGDPLEHRLEVGERVDGDARAANLSGRHRGV